ncbi:hypothetical protein O1611_g6551 [Lasiodiplodia mahajangana]|uniref:Uncharacterized protein n=1 Tax=Lasiodiplodia mahajangana TaxID=1108764 RepID=A0ACC2JHU5_9PEZI|nr:hypothetical protein O1611_g6551 [Lasiodiplodia mahajangana]
MANKRRLFTWLVTNIGVLDGNMLIRPPTGSDSMSDNDQKWTIHRAQFGLSAEIPAAAIEFALVSVTS